MPALRLPKGDASQRPPRRGTGNSSGLIRTAPPALPVEGAHVGRNPHRITPFRSGGRSDATPATSHPP